MALALATGCATVPDDAPTEFLGAEASIDEMNDRDVEEYMPKSAEVANIKFKNALDLLDRSSEESPKVSREQAIEKAEEAKQLADELNSLDSRISSWDSDEQGFSDALARMDGEYDTEVAVIAPVSPFAKLKDAEIISTVAFFETNVAKEAILNENELNALTKILMKDANFQVVLTGYADPRGTSEYNQKLAMQRAKTVAEKLAGSGILNTQIIIESYGEVDDNSEGAVTNSAGKLQLDRKVSAKLILR